jgi:aspartate ammonia-lyase
MNNNILQAELNYFERKRDELLGKARGEYALIHGEQLINTFKSKEDAVKRGYEEFGNVPFLVKEITAVDEVLTFSNFLIS